MGQVKLDKNGVFIPKRVNYKLKKDEEKEEMIEKYLQKNSNFQINYDRKGNAVFIEKERIKKEGKKNE